MTRAPVVYNPAPVAGTRSAGGRDRCDACGAVVDVDTLDGSIIQLEVGSNKEHVCPTGEAEPIEPKNAGPFRRGEMTYLGVRFMWNGYDQQLEKFMKLKKSHGAMEAIKWAIRNEVIKRCS